MTEFTYTYDKNEPLYSDYAVKCKRVQSFRDKDLPFNLANSGFFYAGDGDVKCFHCGIWMKMQEEIPYDVHQKYSPRCKFVIQKAMKYEGFRLKSFEDWPLMEPESLTKRGFFYLHVEDKVQCAFCDSRFSVSKDKEHHFYGCPLRNNRKEPLYPKYADIAKRSRSFGNQSNQIACLVSCGFFNDYHSSNLFCFHCGLCLEDALVDDPYVYHLNRNINCWYFIQEGLKYEKYRLLSFQSRSSFDRLAKIGMYFMNTKIQLVQCAFCPFNFPPEFECDEEYEVERDHASQSSFCPMLTQIHCNNIPIIDSDHVCESSNFNCKVCLEKEVSVLFRPCNHLACCVNCSFQLATCPICRQYIDETIKVYLS